MSVKMKQSGIEWIGEIPEHWEVRKLKYVCDMKTGGTPKESIGVNNYSGVPWIKPSNLTDNVKISQYSQYISEDVFNKCGYTLFPAGSTLLCCIASIGKCGYAIKPVYSNQQITALVPKSNIVSLYITYFIKYLKDKLIYDAACNVVPILNTQYLKNIQMPYPPIEEQRLIAATLNQICGTLDNTKADIEKRIEILNEYKKSIITEAVTKGLDKNVKLKDSGIDWIGEVPEHWDFSRIKYFCTIGSGTDPITESGDTPVYGSGSKSFKTCEEYKTGPTVLLGRKGTINIPQWVEGNYWNVDTAFDVKSKGDFSLRLFYYISICLDYDRYNMQTTVPSMAKGDYENMYIPIPPINEQQEIVAYLDSKCSEIDSIIETKKHQLELLEEYKKSIIYEYVTGKRDVSASLDGVTELLDEVSAKPDFAVTQNTQSAGDSHNE